MIAFSLSICSFIVFLQWHDQNRPTRDQVRDSKISWFQMLWIRSTFMYGHWHRRLKARLHWKSSITMRLTKAINSSRFKTKESIFIWFCCNNCCQFLSSHSHPMRIAIEWWMIEQITCLLAVELPNCGGSFLNCMVKQKVINSKQCAQWNGHEQLKVTY